LEGGVSMEEKETQRKAENGIFTVLIVLLLAPFLYSLFILLIVTSKPNPKKLAQAAESLIPYIAEIRPFVEENWERMDEVRLIYEKHSEDLMTEEEKETIASLFTEECPFTYTDGDIFYTAIESKKGSAQLYVIYLEESELTNEDSWIDYIYYMEELAPNWYACTEPEWYGNNRPVSMKPYRAQRKDGGLARLPSNHSGE
ncbi:MAG: hypothetical protein K2F83_06905, partial [Oscillospiraceae bacterium]|nr:hypothetical protein [Oscillospiraceae bacterium]